MPFFDFLTNFLCIIKMLIHLHVCHHLFNFLRTLRLPLVKRNELQLSTGYFSDYLVILFIYLGNALDFPDRWVTFLNLFSLFFFLTDELLLNRMILNMYIIELIFNIFKYQVLKDLVLIELKASLVSIASFFDI